MAAAVGMMACGGDQSTNTTVVPLTSAQLALHFDTLAGQLPPGDIRLVWYQDIASILALGVSPATAQARLNGGPAVFEMLTEIDAFPDSVNGKPIDDSTYRLAAWFPVTKPSQFVDVRVRYLRAGTGKADTTATYITYYQDTVGQAYLDSSQAASFTVLSNRGLCEVTALKNLTVPSNPCTKVAVDWMIIGGDNLLVIDPVAQVSGTHLTQ